MQGQGRPSPAITLQRHGGRANRTCSHYERCSRRFVGLGSSLCVVAPRVSRQAPDQESQPPHKSPLPDTACSSSASFPRRRESRAFDRLQRSGSPPLRG